MRAAILGVSSNNRDFGRRVANATCSMECERISNNRVEREILGSGWCSVHHMTQFEAAAMSQEQCADADQRRPENAATPQPHDSARDQGLLDASDIAIHSLRPLLDRFPAVPPLQSQLLSGEYPTSSFAAFPNIGQSFLQPHWNMATLPLASPHKGFEIGKGAPGTQSKSPKESTQRPGQGLPPGSVRAYPLWPNYNYKRSRLPSNDVARKVPRKAVASSPPPESTPHLPRPKPAPARRRAPKQKAQKRHDSPTTARATPDVRPGAQRRATPRQTTVGTSPFNDHEQKPSKVRSRPVVRDEDLEDDEDYERDSPMASIESSENTSLHSPPSASTSRMHVHANRPRPQYDYPVPEELEGVHRALGEDNWNDYLILQEAKWIGDITEQQYVARTGAIFAVFDQTTRRNMEKRMANQVIKPVMERHAREQNGGLRHQLP
ncbi:hypothetical protein FB567DRAFT_545674 [Paraphoma chrysanthemicola]|uniref:Uncharacterized protein n=1 Tax=Paraphoma chrysanthemicola TaxID=798071 RepID=A0A8K0RG25_9PLEO|nr:hypothetical protein FB567DRAFT_545674 [Paraphoma chrysanthemicola]